MDWSDEVDCEGKEAVKSSSDAEKPEVTCAGTDYKQVKVLLMFPAITVNFVRCRDGLCIPVSWTCDEQPDCRHGDDEDKKLCGKEEECDGFACGTDSCIPHRYAWSMSLLSKAETVQ